MTTTSLATAPDGPTRRPLQTPEVNEPSAARHSRLVGWRSIHDPRMRLGVARSKHVPPPRALVATLIHALVLVAAGGVARSAVRNTTATARCPNGKPPSAQPSRIQTIQPDLLRPPSL